MRTLRGGPLNANVSLLCWDGDRVLLARRGGGGLFGHTWTLPGGPLRNGETLPGAVTRLAADEAGVEPTAGAVRVIRRIEPPSPFRDDRGPDTLVWVRSWTGGPFPGNVLAVRPGEMGELRMFREARELIARACQAMQRRWAAGTVP
jgi:8-oxo-dGTP pyrophosphatase MutT (NUDIX family)